MTDMIINSNISKVLIIFYINYINILTESDCGLPAIPDSSKLSVYKSRYDEHSIIAYECEDKNSELIEGKYMNCVNHRWNGTLPRCAKEVENVLLKRVEITELGRHQPVYREMQPGQLGRPRSAKILNNNVKYMDCPKTRFLWNVNQSQSWTFQIIRGYYFNYITLYMRGGSLLENYDLKNLVMSATTEDIISFKSCKIERFVRLNDSITYKIGFICDQIERMVVNHEGIDESIEKIVIKVEVKDGINITTIFCDLRLYTTSDLCGSPEKPLNSVILAPEKTYTVYSCREGFYLEGNQKVRCSWSGTWLNEFPICKPNKTCKIPAIDTEDPYLRVQYKYMHQINGNLFAEPDDVAFYTCIDPNSTHPMRMEGMASRICRDGNWSGYQPLCHHYNDKNSREMSFHISSMPKEMSKTYSMTKIFVIIMAMFGSFFVGAISVALILYLIAKRKKSSHKRPKISIVIDESDDLIYDRPQEYSSFRVSQTSNFSNEILNPLYEDFQKYTNPLNIPLDEENSLKKV